MQVSFIIPLFNCLPLTRACLDSLRQTLPADLAHEIILIDNASTDGTVEWLASLPASIRVVRNPANLGYAHANNQGAALAQGELLCLLNNDLVFDHAWLAPLLRLHRRLGQRAGAIGNVQRRVSDHAIDHAGIFINARGKPEHDQVWHYWLGRSRLVPAVTGACLLINRSRFLSLGGLDEQFVNGGEDIDLCLRLRELGLINAVALHSVISHHVSAAPGRKLHDETNSRLLACKWKTQLMQLAWRRWCWAELDRRSGGRAPANWRADLSILIDALGLRAGPSASARTGLDRMMEAEFERWKLIASSGAGA